MNKWLLCSGLCAAAGALADSNPVASVALLVAGMGAMPFWKRISLPEG